ncbi:MAG: CRISPR-associated endonuclease Cas1 [Methanosarcina sp.]|jgi:CRISP-associated protein Cas1
MRFNEIALYYPHAGFLHEINPGKNSLAYDLQEPFRFLVDLTVINLVENGRKTQRIVFCSP